MMITQQSWPQTQTKVRDRWNKLTEDDCKAIAGNREQLLSKIQKAYSISREEAERQVREFEQGADQGGQQRVGDSSRPSSQGAGKPGDPTSPDSRKGAPQPSRESPSRTRDSNEDAGGQSRQQASE